MTSPAGEESSEMDWADLDSVTENACAKQVPKDLCKLTHMEHEDSTSNNPSPQPETGINSIDLDRFIPNDMEQEQSTLKNPEPETGNDLDRDVPTDKTVMTEEESPSNGFAAQSNISELSSMNQKGANSPSSNENSGQICSRSLSFSCDACLFGCMDESTLKEHAYIHTGRIEHFSCSTCNYKCISRSTMDIHLKTHDEFQTINPICDENQPLENSIVEKIFGIKRPYKCDLCNFSCSNESVLMKHTYIHSGKTKHFACNLCNYKCTSRRTINIHVQSHNEECAFQTLDPTCDKNQPLEENWSIGENLIGIKPFKCDLCNFGCVYEYTLKNHAAIHAGTQKHFSCNLCNYKCLSRRTINVHLRTHDEECSYQIIDPCNENQQLENTTGNRLGKKKPYKCKFCSFRCCHDFTLKKHVHIHTGSKKHYSCDLCNYKCASRHVINIHIRTHGKECSFQTIYPNCEKPQQLENTTVVSVVAEKPYICELCSFSCLRELDLKKHAYIHTGTKEHLSCNLCNYKCFSRRTIHNHLRTHDETRSYQIIDPISGKNVCVNVKNHSMNSPDVGPTMECSSQYLLENSNPVTIKTEPSSYNLNRSSDDFSSDPRKFKLETENSNKLLISSISDLAVEQQGLEQQGSGTAFKTNKNSIPKKIQRPAILSSKIYRCDLCPYKCRYNIEAINAHKDIHNGQSSKYYSCDTCDYKNLHSSNMKRHIKNTHGNNPICTFRVNSKCNTTLNKEVQKLMLHCNFCSYSCREERDLNFHMKIHNGQSKFYSCNICDYKCVFPQTIKFHVKANHGDTLLNSYKFNDPTIDSSLFNFEQENTEKNNSNENVNNIASSVDSEETEEYFDCHLCAFSCTSQELTDNHIKNHAKRFTCFECDFKCTNPHTFEAHTQKHNEEVNIQKTKISAIKSEDDESSRNKSYSCSFCKFVTPVEVILKSHLKNMHKQQISYACNACPFTATDEQSIENHMEIHLGVSSYYSCNLCDYLCEANINVIKNHLLDQHGVADECSFEFNLPALGLANVKSEFNSNEIGTSIDVNSPKHANNFSCSRCDYICRASDELKLHQKIHSGETDYYSCNVCNYKCTDYVIIMEHCVRKHKDLQPPLFKFKTSSNGNLLRRIKVEGEESNERTDGSANNVNSITHKDENSLTPNKPEYAFAISELEAPQNINTNVENSFKGFPSEDGNYNSESDEECNNKNVKYTSSNDDSFSDFEVEENQDGSLDNNKLDSVHMTNMNDDGCTPFLINSLYVCPICSYSSKARSLVLKHMGIHNGSITSYCSCNICDYKCTRRKAMNRHLQNHRSDNESIQLLPGLSYTYIKQGSILAPYKPKKNTFIKQESILAPYKSKKRLFYCRSCKYTCTVETLLLGHKKIHTGEAKHYYSCKLCKYFCVSRLQMKVHMQKSHNAHQYEYRFFKDGVESKMSKFLTPLRKSSGVLRTSCNICNFSCFSSGMMSGHMKIHLGKSKQRYYSCDLCNFKCAARQTVVTHMKIHGKSSEAFHAVSPKSKVVPRPINNTHINCTLCDYKCSSDLTLKIHMKAHRQNQTLSSNKSPLETNKQYRCKQCSYVTSILANLYVHMKSHNSNQLCFTCDKCEFTTKSQDLFQAHSKMHSESKIVDSAAKSTADMLSCSFCDFKCEHSSTLKDHTSTHPEHICFICESPILNKEEYKRHMDGHSSERFPCILCNRRFVHEKNFLEHMENHMYEKF